MFSHAGIYCPELNLPDVCPELVKLGPPGSVVPTLAAVEVMGTGVLVTPGKNIKRTSQLMFTQPLTPVADLTIQSIPTIENRIMNPVILHRHPKISVPLLLSYQDFGLVLIIFNSHVICILNCTISGLYTFISKDCFQINRTLCPNHIALRHNSNNDENHHENNHETFGIIKLLKVTTFNCYFYI